MKVLESLPPTIWYQNPYKYRLIELDFLATSCRTRRTLGDSRIRSFTISLSNWIGQGARGEHGESAHSVLIAGGPPEATPDVTKLGPSRPIDASHLYRLPLPRGRCNGSTSSPQPRRAKPHRKPSSIATGWPSFGEPPLWRRRAWLVSLPWSAGAPGAAHSEIKGRD
jgi:hypothetical protein